VRGTYREGHGHHHVPPVDGRDVEDAGSGVGVYPLNRTRGFPQGGLRAARRGGECPDGVPHQHCRAGLDCRGTRENQAKVSKTENA